MGVLFTFLTYISAAFLIGMTFLGAGRPIFQMLNKAAQYPITVTTIIYELIIGFCSTYIFTVLLFTYLPASWAIKIGLLLLCLLLGLATRDILIRIINLPSRKILLISFALFILSFILVYLPFSNARQIFLASEGGGDITAYLGFANVFLNQVGNPFVAVPRFFITARWWLEGMGFVTINRPSVYAGIDPALIAFNRDLAATNYLPTLFYFPLRFMFPVEVIYMSLWMLITAIIPIVVALTIPKTIKHFLTWRVVAFILVAFSAGLQSVFLNHYIHQLRSILMIATLYLGVVQLFTNEFTPKLNSVICFLSITVVCMSYFPATPVILIVSIWGFFLFFLKNFWKNPTKSIFSYFKLQSIGWVLFGLLLLLPLLVEPYLRLSVIPMVFTPKNPEDLKVAYLTWGPSIHSFSEIWNAIQGTLIHNLVQPYASLDIHMVWNYQVAFYSAVLAIFCLLLILILIKKWIALNEIWNNHFLIVILSLGSLVIIGGLLFISNTHSYIFDKMATLCLPITIASILLLFSINVSEASGKIRWGVTLLAAIFLGSWLFGNLQTRFYQINSFLEGKNKAAILYTQSYLKSLRFSQDFKHSITEYSTPTILKYLQLGINNYLSSKIGTNISNEFSSNLTFSIPEHVPVTQHYLSLEINKDINNSAVPQIPSRTIMYSNSDIAGTSYFLMEASLAGLNTFPANNYYHSNYPEFLSKIDFRKSNYVISYNDREANAYDITHFYLGNSNDYAVPIDATLNSKLSTLPKHIVIERPTEEGTAIVIHASNNWKIKCQLFEKNNKCVMDQAPMGAKSYASVLGHVNIDGATCVFRVNAKEYLQVLRFKQCHEISFVQS